ncbi:MAG: hypothetical protein U1G07_13465 [Verrucomicrobiota bacterium]
MIHVSRGPGPPILTDANGAGKRELAKALRIFGRKLRVAPAPKGKPGKRAVKAGIRHNRATLSFKAYSHPSVKASLEALFHGKCAYCENRYAGVHPVDVEHWRPKGAVLVASGGKPAKRPKHPGYYWLAAEWTNLLPSCIDCNRGRTQLELPSGEKRNLGKANQFPLLDEAKRAYRPEESAAEEPLLLNPCEDYPESHFEFRQNAVIVPKRDAPLQARQRAAASITVYALNRVGLVDDRRTAYLQLVKDRFELQKFVQLLDRAPKTLVPELRDMLSRKIADLIEALDSKKPFALMARQSIMPFLDSLTAGAAGAALQQNNWAAASKPLRGPSARNAAR